MFIKLTEKQKELAKRQFRDIVNYLYFGIVCILIYIGYLFYILYSEEMNLNEKKAEFLSKIHSSRLKAEEVIDMATLKASQTNVDVLLIHKTTKTVIPGNQIKK